MFISVLDLFKIGLGPSSSHTMGPLTAASRFRQEVEEYLRTEVVSEALRIKVQLFGSLAWTGKGHQSDTAVLLGLHGYDNRMAAGESITVGWEEQIEDLSKKDRLDFSTGSSFGSSFDASIVASTNASSGVSAQGATVAFFLPEDLSFETGQPAGKHPNRMLFTLWEDGRSPPRLSRTYYSIGGGFILTEGKFEDVNAPIRLRQRSDHPYPFSSAKELLTHCSEADLSIAQVKRANELCRYTPKELADHLREIWASMSDCLQSGLGASSEFLPGPIHIKRRASQLFAALQKETVSEITDRLCTYAMAVNEENASGHLVVTAPTNGAAGVIPAVIQVLREQAGAESRSLSKISQKTEDFLLTAAAVGALVKQNSSIAGAEVGCQGEVGTASAMAAAGICAWKGGSPKQVENAAEIALEHHLGLTCDPVRGLVQVPCIERNGFGAVKAWTAAHLALRGDGSHYMPLDNCIQAMRETGQAMSEKFKETSLGGLAVNATEC